MKPAGIIRIVTLSALVNLAACGDTKNTIQAGSIDTSSCESRIEWVDSSIEVARLPIDEVCSVIDNYKAKRISEAVTMMEAPCPKVDQMAASVGGVDRLRELVNMGELDHDQNAKGIVSFCISSSDAKRSFLAKSLESSWSRSRIYSVGTIHKDGSTCSSGLVASVSSDAEVFYLVGSGEKCLDVYLADADEDAYHPEKNPKGIRFGDYIKSKHRYEGAIPDSFLYKSKRYDFTGSK